ncbi:MAG: DUF1080 domain-containing protein [Gemmataceae bacterium]|nr:DUF1080 domain-containing protein [Gemmataceae bacterium]MCI0743145.1 DUF1080 domain-containing protein [Gemmataceae bacterium]
MRTVMLALPLACCTLLGSVGNAGDFKIEDGYTSLFNGKDLSGWKYYKEDLEGKSATADKRFTVENGAIVANVGGGIKDLFSVNQFGSDFHLKLEVRAGLKADSGVYIRSSGDQLQVRDYVRRGERKQLKKFKNDDWNELDITVKWGKVTTTVNGKALSAKNVLQLTVKDGQPTATVDGQSVELGSVQVAITGVAHCLCNGEFLEDMPVKQKTGGIGLQAESGKFEFRRIRVKELP